jgi:hypothetical protein
VQVRIDERVALCLQKLKLPEFKPLLDYLRESRDGTLEDLAEAPPNTIQRLQGEAAVLKKLLSSIENSSELVAKLKSRP